MLSRLFFTLRQVSPSLKRFLWKQWYQFLASKYRMNDWSFMNYGFEPLNHHTDWLRLDETDEPDRYSIQLYHHVANAVNLGNLDVLEVGSGRGGGASYVMRYLKPRRMVGVDFSEKAVEFCRENHEVAGLSFIKGDAEFLPFDNSYFDAVINVESSHCYGSMDTFLAEVKRVLRQDGYFLYADLRSKDDTDILRRQMENSGMTILQENDITPNVVRSMDSDNERKLALIHGLVKKWLLKSFLEFAGVKGSKIYEGLRKGSIIYTQYVLQK